MSDIQSITIAFQMINILILLMELRRRLKNKSDLSASKKFNHVIQIGNGRYGRRRKQNALKREDR